MYINMRVTLAQKNEASIKKEGIMSRFREEQEILFEMQKEKILFSKVYFMN